MIPRGVLKRPFRTGSANSEAPEAIFLRKNDRGFPLWGRYKSQERQVAELSTLGFFGVHSFSTPLQSFALTVVGICSTLAGITNPGF